MSELMDEAVIRMPFDMAMESELSRKQFYDRANSALSELIELRANLAAMDSQTTVAYVDKNDDDQWAEILPDVSVEVDQLLYAKPTPADKPDHWAVMSPGRADQYRAESVAVRKELGFSADSDEVAPIDLLNAIRQIRADTVPEAIKLLQRVAEKTTERDPFEAERLAIKFCEQRGLEDGSVSYRQSIDAFTTAYRMRPTSAAPSHSQQSALEPVEGDLLPPVGTNVAIHLASNDKWVNHKVVGYYVWGPLGGVSDSYSRVFVRVVDGHGIQNARLLKDIKWDRCPSHESEQGGEHV